MAIESRHRRKLGYADYCLLPTDGRRHEIIDGDHYVNPAPSLVHQTVSGRLQYQLYTQVELKGLGRVFNAPCDVELAEHDIVQPDLIVVSAARERILTPSRIRGVPDLVVEILSPSTAVLDRTVKLALYQRAGVPEYWVVDPEQQSIEQHVLRQCAYVLDGRRSSEIVWHGLPDVCVDLTRVW